MTAVLTRPGSMPPIWGWPSRSGTMCWMPPPPQRSWVSRWDRTAPTAKTTYVTLLGVEGCREQVVEHTRLAKEALERGGWRGSIGCLCWLADHLAQRSN